VKKMMQPKQSNRTSRLIVGSILYQAVWFATVLSAGQVSRWWWGVLGVLVYIAVVLPLWPTLWRRVVIMAVIGVLTGLVMDSGMIWFHVWSTPRVAVPHPLPPVWLILLWSAFGMYIALSLEMLYGRYLFSSVVGAIGGMLAYRGGVPFGAIEMGASVWLSTVVLMIAWAIAFPALIWVATRLAKAFPAL
jgi:hypothetical protein